jgi:uncharacterized surface protein with fasciclin (FAS1) repeats
MTGFDANNLYSTHGKTLGDTSSKGAWYVPNTRFNAQGQLVAGPQWHGTVDPFPKDYSANEFITGNADPGGGPNLLTLNIAIAMHQLGGMSGCQPAPMPICLSDVVYNNLNCTPTSDLPTSAEPCPPVCMPLPPVAPYPQHTMPYSHTMPYPNPMPYATPYPQTPYSPSPYSHGNGNRQQRLHQLMNMIKQLFNGQDQGLPLNETLPSPFGYSYMSPYSSPYADLNPWSSPSSSSRYPSHMSPTPHTGLNNWLSQAFNPNLTNQTKTSSIYPPITGTTDLLNRTGVFPTLGSLLNRGGLTPTLTNLEKQGALIVFAPTEQAFQRLAQSNPRLFQQLQDPRNVNILNEILKYHVSQASRSNFQFPATNTHIDSLTSRDAIKYTGNAFKGNIMNGNQLVTTGRALKLPNQTLIIPIDEVLIPPGLDLSKLC